MSSPTKIPASGHFPLGIIGCCFVLAAVVWLSFPLVAYFQHHRTGIDGVLAAAVAAGVCWICSTAAIVMTYICRGTVHAVSGLFGATFFRTVLPLMAAVVLTNTSRYLDESGLFGSLLVFYFVTLVVETILAVGLVKDASVAASEPRPGNSTSGH